MPYRCKYKATAKPEHCTTMAKHVKVSAWYVEGVVWQYQLQGALCKCKRQCNERSCE